MVADPSRAQSSDAECVARARTGDLRGFDEMVRTYSPRIFTHAVRMLRNREEAEDVVQETFLRAYRSLASYDERRPFRSWLYAIATNLALNALRSRQRRGVAVTLDFASDPEEVDARAPLPDPRQFAERAELSRWLADAVAALPAQPAALMHLHYVEGMSIREAAELLDMTEDAAKVALHRARKKLRLLLAQDEPGTPSGSRGGTW